ncbi:MAG: hypothetical protein KC421_01660, partial [Anaerolineales bacterium]|nr:hypothetical protein [Anaerolineales bacterium]
GILGTRYPTPYDTYRRLLEESQAVKTAVSPSRHQLQNQPPTADPSRKLTWKQKQELFQLEERIAELEETVASLADRINQTGNDYIKLQSLADKLEATKADLETAESRWLELSEIAENSQ